jgi:hypothetical protein
MPLTCIQTLVTGELTRLDATNLRGEVWSAIHRVKPRPMLFCPECGVRLHAKRSHKRLRFFAHDLANRHCSLTGETEEHRHLKRLIAERVRSERGWHAIIEAGPDDGDHGGWRADVLASGPEGRRIAFEIQLAPMTTAVGRDRAAQYDADRVESIWITPENPQWVMRIPTLVISAPGPLTEADAGQIRVVLGVWQLGRSGRLEPRGGNPPLDGIVARLLTGHLRTHVLVRPDELKVVIAPAEDIDVAARKPSALVAPAPSQELPPVRRPRRGEGYPKHKDEASLYYGLDAWGDEVYRSLYQARQRFEQASELEITGRAAAEESQGDRFLDSARKQIDDLRAELDEYERRIEVEAGDLRPDVDHSRIVRYGRGKLEWAQSEFATLRAAARNQVPNTAATVNMPTTEADNKVGDADLDNALFRARKCFAEASEAQGAERGRLEALALGHLEVAARQIAAMERRAGILAHMAAEKSDEAARSITTAHERRLRDEAIEDARHHEHSLQVTRDLIGRAQRHLARLQAAHSVTLD